MAADQMEENHMVGAQKHRSRRGTGRSALAMGVFITLTLSAVLLGPVAEFSQASPSIGGDALAQSPGASPIDPLLGAGNSAPGLSRLQAAWNKGLRRAGIEPYSLHPSGEEPYAVCPPPSKTEA